MDETPETLSSAYQAFAEHLADEARKVPDPIERVRLVLRLLDAGREADRTIAWVSAEAVWALHHEGGVSYAEIGRRLGVSRARAQQLGSRVNGRVDV